ncbi:MAG: PadR family transcriptional regulator [Anaerolineae bacterium]|nr:PadR family transcriptional regulator [Anaerolineae bacterium]
MTGYDIRKRLCETMSMIASPGYGAVYPTLHRLLNEGAVTVNVVQQDGRPAKKVYSITRPGREELWAWLREPSEPDKITREFLLKVLLAQNLEPEDFKQHLERRRKETETLYKSLEELKAQPGQRVNGHHNLVIAYAQEMCKAEMRWLDRVERDLNCDGGPGEAAVYT